MCCAESVVISQHTDGRSLYYPTVLWRRRLTRSSSEENSCTKRQLECQGEDGLDEVGALMEVEVGIVRCGI